MGLSYLEIASVVNALQGLKGALFQEFYQPTATEVYLAMRSSRESLLLLLSIHPHLSRAHLVEQRPHNPQKPFSFQMLCRKELRGRLASIEQLNSDRVMKLRFESETPRALVAELTERHGNIFLLDEHDRVLGSLRPPGKNRRRLYPQQDYITPPAARGPIRAQHRFEEHGEAFDIHREMERFFRQKAEELAFTTLTEKLRKGLRQEIKRLEKRQRDLLEDMARAEMAEKHKRFGDLLQIHSRELRRGQARAVVPDSFSEDPDALVEVPLDPKLDAIGNAQRHYRLYRKYDASIPIVLERTEATEAELSTRIHQLQKVEAAEDEATLRQLEKEISLRSRLRAPQMRSTKGMAREPFLRFRSSRGQEIWVGRGSRDNDALTFRVARGNDFWLHIRGRPGCHVVIPARAQVPDLETLLDAATLAIKYSGIREGESAEVAYTRVKYVRRIPGKPGLVTFSQDKTLHVSADRGRLATLEKVEVNSIRY